jgi:hypothetical protein
LTGAGDLRILGKKKKRFFAELARKGKRGVPNASNSMEGRKKRRKPFCQQPTLREGMGRERSRDASEPCTLFFEFEDQHMKKKGTGVRYEIN